MTLVFRTTRTWFSSGPRSENWVIPRHFRRRRRRLNAPRHFSAWQRVPRCIDLHSPHKHWMHSVLNRVYFRVFLSSNFKNFSKPAQSRVSLLSLNFVTSLSRVWQSIQFLLFCVLCVISLVGTCSEIVNVVFQCLKITEFESKIVQQSMFFNVFRCFCVCSSYFGSFLARKTPKFSQNQFLNSYFSSH